MYGEHRVMYEEPAMGRMQRTQIYLEEEQARALDRIARRRGVSRAEVLRLAADRFISDEEPDPIWGLVGIGASAEMEEEAEPVPDDRVAELHDRVLVEHTLKQMREYDQQMREYRERMREDGS
jgi:hypothetical protein